MKTLTREGIQRMSGNNGSTVVGGSGSGGGGGGGSASYASEAGHAQTADEATHATSADTATTAGSASYATEAGTAAEATHATSADSATNADYATEAGTAAEATHATAAANLDANSSDWQKILRKDIADTAVEVITFAKGIVSTLVSKFKAGIKIGASDQYEIDANGDATLRDITARGITASGNASIGGNLSVTGSTTTKNLSVTGEAHFFKLVVDEMLSNKGAIIISNASCVAEVVVAASGYYDVYFSTTDRDGNAVSNPWVVGDGAICMTFKTEGAGTFSNISNRYYWRRVTQIGSNVTYNGSTYHRVRLSNVSGGYDGSTTPAAGDNIVQLGYNGSVSGNEYRKSAIILSAYPTMDSGLTPPALAFYKGINDFVLTTHRYTYMDGLSNEFIGNFKILVNGSYNSLTTVLATMEGLISNVSKTVRSKNLIPSQGWTDYYGAMLPVTNFVPDSQKLMNGNADVIYSANFFLPAGTYVFSHYCSSTSVMLYVYGIDTPSNCASDISDDTIFHGNISNTVSGDTYQSTARRYVSFTLDDDAYVIMNLYLSGSAFTSYRPQLEAGSTPTTWELGTVDRSSQIKQTADEIDLSVRTALGEAGINISGSTREINLIAGQVNFLASGGQATNPKISIDPTTGALNATDGNFSGTIRAENLYHGVVMHNSEDTYYCYETLPSESGHTYPYTVGSYYNASNLDSYWGSRGLILCTGSADMIVIKATINDASGTVTITLPRAQDFQGKMIEIIDTRYTQPSASPIADLYVQAVDYINNIGRMKYSFIDTSERLELKLGYSNYHNGQRFQLISSRVGTGSTFYWVLLGQTY